MTTKALMVGTLAGVMAMGAGQAQAGAKAFSYLEVTGLIAADTNGVQLTAADFSGFNAADTGQISGSLLDFGNFQDSGTSESNCIGLTCPPPNQFTMNDINSGLHFSRAANALSGQAILPGGANAQTVAEVILDFTSQGLSQSIVGTAITFTFGLEQAQAIQINFAAALDIFVQLHQEDGFVFASTGWTITITDPNGGQVLAWSPDGLANDPSCTGLAGCVELADSFNMNTNRALLDQLGPSMVMVSGNFSVQTGVLSADTLYTVVINHEVNVDASATKAVVPEPASLMLFGTGLLGMGLMGWRRRRQTAA